MASIAFSSAPVSVIRETTTGSRRVSRGVRLDDRPLLLLRVVARPARPGRWGPTVQPGIACGVTSHSTAPFVAPFATSERTTNQPLLCWPRPSTSSSPPPVTSSMVMRWRSDSGAMTSRFPVASGAIWYSPFASRVPGPLAWRGKMPALRLGREGLAEEDPREELQVEADPADPLVRQRLLEVHEDAERLALGTHAHRVGEAEVRVVDRVEALAVLRLVGELRAQADLAGRAGPPRACRPSAPAATGPASGRGGGRRSSRRARRSG